MFAASKTAKAASAAAATDPQFNYVTMLLHGDGTNGAQNNTFLDSSTNNFTITRNGNTTQGTYSPYGANWSNYFNGSSAVVNRSNNTALAMGTGDFTIEFWMNAPSTSSVIVLYDSRLTTSSSTGGMNIYHQSGTLYLYGGATTNVLLVSASITYNQWNHIAFVKSGSGTGNVKMYVNGVLSSTYGSADTSNYSLGYLAIGAFYNPSLDSFYTGYLSNFRIVKGTAVYTSAFTPSTTPLTAITNTSLLTCADNRFIDDSTNAFAITVNGDTSVQRFSPFAPTSAYSTSTVGGSGFFDGTGDFLGVANTINASGNFTLEFWMYATGYGSATFGSMVGASAGSPSNICQLQLWNSSNPNRILGYVGAASGTGNLSPTLSQPVLNRWIHIAVARFGSTITMYENGISVATLTNSNTINFATGMQIGADGASNYPFQGYITDSRLVVGTAVYTANFTPPTAPLTAVTNTSVLLNYTNAGIFDNAMMNDLETVGNAQISTSVKKYGTGSMYFDGTGDGLQAIGTPNTAFSTGDFTVEFWIYLNANTGTFKKFVELGTSGACFTIETQGTNNVLNVTDLNTTVFITSSTALSLTTWTHVAVTRSGTSMKLFQNGTQVGSATNSTNFANSGNVYIGQSNSGQAVNCYMDDLRITKGYARYTSNFTPPTAAFPNN
jgi:hypothetical protein